MNPAEPFNIKPGTRVKRAQWDPDCTADVTNMKSAKTPMKENLKRLAENHTRILTFYLHVSKNEPFERFRARLEDPTKHWKANLTDSEERQYWRDYIRGYEDALTKCSTSYAPWFVIPANRKWFRNLAISEILVKCLAKL